MRHTSIVQRNKLNDLNKLVSNLVKLIFSDPKRNVICLGLLIVLFNIFIISSLILLKKEIKADSLFNFDEGYGNTVYDENSSITGTITDATWKTDDLCRSNKCLYFDGDGDYVTFADNDDLDITDTDTATVEGWFRHATMPDSSIDINHETADLNQYTSSITDSGDLSVTVNAALNESGYGLQAVIDDTTTIYGQKSFSSPSSGIIRGQFYFDPNTFSNTNDWTGFKPFSVVLNIAPWSILEVKAFKVNPSTYYLQLQGYNDSSGYWVIPDKVISDGPHFVEFVLTQATTNVSSDGRAEFWIDGISKGTYTGIDNYDLWSEIYGIRFGATEVSSGVSGTIFLDELEVYTNNTQTLLTKYENSASDGGYKIRMELDGDLTCGVDNANAFPSDSVTSTSADYDDNRWHHFACVKDGTSSLSLYLDAKLIGTDSSITTSTLANDDTLYLGIDGDGVTNDYQGFLDEIKIYKSDARSADEIKTDFAGITPNKGSAAVFNDGSKYLSDGLVGYWKTDEAYWNGTSDEVIDTSGNGNHLTRSGQATTAGTSKFGMAGVFDGTGDYASRNNNNLTGLNLSGQYLTISAWVNPTDTTNLEAIGGKCNFGPATSDSYCLYSQNKIFRLKIDNGTVNATALANAAFTAGQWYHVVGVFDGSLPSANLKLYLNGVLQTSTGTLAGNINNPALNFYIGDRHGGSYSFNGQIDEARIYNRALSSSEVSQLYNWAPGPIAHWKMDEGNWNGTSGEVKDTSGDNLNGTSYGNAAISPGKFGNAGVFNGTSSYIDISDNDLLSPTNEITYETWINFTQLPSVKGSTEYLIEKRDTSGSPEWQSYYLLVNTSNEPYARWTDSSGTNYNATSAFTFSAGTWYHVAVTKNATALKIYVNGVDVTFSSDTPSGTNLNSNGTLRIGSDSTTSGNTNGKIDDVRIYNYARTPAQIIEDMNTGHPAPGSPVGSAYIHYDLDEGNLDTAHNSGNSGSTYNGNLAASDSCPGDTNCPTWTNSGKYGKALSFDGGDYASFTTPSFIDIDSTADSQGTLSFWMHPNWDSQTITTTHVVTGTIDAAIGDGVVIGFGGTDVGLSGNLGFTLYDNFAIQSEVYIPNNQLSWSSGDWVHVVAVWDDTLSTNDTHLYINGVESTHLHTNEGALDFSSATVNLPNSMYIGEDNTLVDYTYDGLIDDYQIFNSALTAEQVKLLYNQSSGSVMGSLSTDSSDNPSNSSTDSYCPPGQGTACVGPVIEWKFNENSGTTLNDTSSNGNNGTFDINPSDWIRGKHGSALFFNGSNSSPEGVYKNTSSTITAYPFTLQAWIKHSMNSSNAHIVSLGDKDNQNVVFSISTDNEGDPRIYLSTQTQSPCAATNTVTQINDDKWHFLTTVFESNTSRYLYIDGKLDHNDTTNCLFSADIDRIAAGMPPAGAFLGNYYSGSIDEVRFYNYTRTPAQIAWDYNHGGPIAHYAFDECSGETVYNSAPKADPRSTELYPGTIYPVGGDGDNDTVGTCGSEITTEMWNDGTTGKYNGSVGFDGTNDYVDLGTLDVTKFTQISLSAWFKTDLLSNYRRIISIFHSGTDDIRIYLDGTNLYGNMDDGSFANISTPFSDTTNWNHVILTNDNGVTNLYLNGKLAATSSSDTYNYAAATGTTHIGHQVNNEVPQSHFSGQLDEVKIWNYALTAEQVKLEYNGGSVNFGN